MKSDELRQIIKEEIKNIIQESNLKSSGKEDKESVISQIYQWIIKGDMKKAAKAMQNDPVLLKLASNISELKVELIKRMKQDPGTYNMFQDAISKIKNEKGIN